MPPHLSPLPSDARSRGLTRADVLVSTLAAALLALLLGGLPRTVPTDTTPAGRQTLQGVSHAVTCQNNLRQLGRGVAAMHADFNRFNPNLDDAGRGPINMLYTWVDILYERGYFDDDALRYCPADQRPDQVMAWRGELWSNFRFVNEFGVNETPKPGVRTSYGINQVVLFDWREDEYVDASRQFYAMDATWDLVGGLNAWWLNVSRYGADLVGDRVNDPGYAINLPDWAGNMTAWRHADRDDASNALLMDGSVRGVKPRLFPDLTSEVWKGWGDEGPFTVDRVQTFGWLPGEQANVIIGGSRYHGTIAAWQDRTPRADGFTTNPQKPIALDPNWYTRNETWTRFPADPADRR